MLYTGPFEITATTIVRAIAVGEDALPSRVSTFSFMLNEHLSLPLLSITVDDFPEFRIMYYNGYKGNSARGKLRFL
jgi:hypothetical protein